MKTTELRGKLYRFVLNFCDEAQGVGLLNGIYSTGMPDLRIQRLSQHFNDCLNVPTLEQQHINGCNPEFWFTEKGLDVFQNDISGIVKELPPVWTVGAAMIRLDKLILAVINQPDVSPSDPPVILYSDEYQVALTDVVRQRFCPVTFNQRKCARYLKGRLLCD